MLKNLESLCQPDVYLNLNPVDPAHFVKWRHSKTISKCGFTPHQLLSKVEIYTLALPGPVKQGRPSFSPM